MDEELMSTSELMEKRERELYLELGKCNFDDAKRQKLIQEAKTLADIKNAYDSTENARLNNNAKNSIEEEKLVIEAGRLKNEKRRNIVEVVKIGLYVVAGVGINLGSYMLDPWFQKDNRMQRFGERLHDMLTKK